MNTTTPQSLQSKVNMMQAGNITHITSHDYETLSALIREAIKNEFNEDTDTVSGRIEEFRAENGAWIDFEYEVTAHYTASYNYYPEWGVSEKITDTCDYRLSSITDLSTTDVEGDDVNTDFDYKRINIQ